MKILNKKQITQKIHRLAVEILEHNLEEEEIILAGINNNGVVFADMLLQRLLEITDIPIKFTRIRLNPAAPDSTEVILGMPIEQVRNRVIIIVDDVANTGRTIYYATKPLLETLPKKIEVAVLVDRKHKSFPVKISYVGLSLATTLHENIEVHLQDDDELAVYMNN